MSSLHRALSQPKFDDRFDHSRVCWVKVFPYHQMRRLFILNKLIRRQKPTKSENMVRDQVFGHDGGAFAIYCQIAIMTVLFGYLPNGWVNRRKLMNVNSLKTLGHPSIVRYEEHLKCFCWPTNCVWSVRVSSDTNTMEQSRNRFAWPMFLFSIAYHRVVVLHAVCYVSLFMLRAEAPELLFLNNVLIRMCVVFFFASPEKHARTESKTQHIVRRIESNITNHRPYKWNKSQMISSFNVHIDSIICIYFAVCLFLCGDFCACFRSFALPSSGFCRPRRPQQSREIEKQLGQHNVALCHRLSASDAKSMAITVRTIFAEAKQKKNHQNNIKWQLVVSRPKTKNY